MLRLNGSNDDEFKEAFTTDPHFSKIKATVWRLDMATRLGAFANFHLGGGLLYLFNNICIWLEGRYYCY